MPQPSSTTSRPATSPMHADLGLRDREDPQSISSCPHASPCGLAGVLGVRLRPDLDVPRARRTQTSSSSANQSEISRCADSGESEPWMRLFGIESRSRRGSCLARRRRGSSPRSSFASSRSRPRPRRRAPSRRGGDEGDELAEERLLAVLGVVLLAELALTRRSLPPTTAKPRRSIRARSSPESARSVASGLIRIRVRSTAIGPGCYSSPAARFRGAVQESAIVSSIPGRLGVDDGRRAVGADLPERLERGVALDARLLQPGRADRADEEGRLDRGAADGAVQVALRQPLLHRPDLELALAHVLDVLRRAEEEVDDRADERRHEPEHRRHRDEPRILDPPARVLVDPVGGREPEDGDEEDRQVARHHPRARVEEVVDSSEQIVVGGGGGEDHKSSLPTR